MSKVKVVKYDEGPYVIQGEVELFDGKGNIFQTGDSIALCRCSFSNTQPFCDGSHRGACFKEASGAR